MITKKETSFTLGDGLTVHGALREVFRGALEPLADKSHLETNFSVLPQELR